MTRFGEAPVLMIVAVAVLGAVSCGADNTQVWLSADVDGSGASDANGLDAADANASDASDSDTAGDGIASACVDDDYGMTTAALAIEVDGSAEFTGMVACANARDWFSVTAAPGSTVDVHVVAEGPVTLVAGEGAELAMDGPSAVPSVSVISSDELLRFSVAGGATDVSYAVSVVVEPAPELIPAVVTGVVRYQDRAYDGEGFTGELPWTTVSGIRVQVFRQSDGAVVSEAVTKDGGTYEIMFDGVDGEEYGVRTTSVGTFDDFRVEVRDRSGSSALYSLESAVFEANVEGVAGVDLDALADDPMGGALNILDQTLAGFRFVARFSDERSPTLTYFWQPGLSYDCGSCYQNNAIRLGAQVADPDEYDDDIILHEFAHYVVHHFGYDDSSGGSHRDRIVDPLLAYGEGLAYFLSSAIRNDPTMVDTFLEDVRFIDYEAVTIGGESLDAFFGTSDGTVRGRVREEIPAALLWDVYDAASDAEPWDTVSMQDAMLRVLFDDLHGRPSVDVGPRGIEITDAFNAFACALGETAGFQALMDERDFPWSVEDALECP